METKTSEEENHESCFLLTLLVEGVHFLKWK